MIKSQKIFLICLETDAVFTAYSKFHSVRKSSMSIIPGFVHYMHDRSLDDVRCVTTPGNIGQLFADYEESQCIAYNWASISS